MKNIEHAARGNGVDGESTLVEKADPNVSSSSLARAKLSRAQKKERKQTNKQIKSYVRPGAGW